jgi:O-succinylbenzoate synthase
MESEKKRKLLHETKPQFIILKPGLLGGFKACEEWINLASEKKIEWWVTSALESNIGLNAIAQWTYNLKNNLPQGLGTGQLYSNNFECPLNIKEGKLFYNPNEKWDLKALLT